MTTRSRGPLAGFEWLRRSISLAFGHPKPIFGGAIVVLLAGLVPSLIVLPTKHLMLQTGTPPDLTTFGWIMLGSMLIGLLLVPLYAGYLQVIDAAENGQLARARDIFKPYLEGDALRLIGYGLMLMLIYTAIFGIVLLATKGNVVDWYVQAMAAQTHHQQPPPLPDGFGTMIALSMAFGIFMMCFYSISLGQVALRRCNVINALGDGCIGALKNLLPVLILAIGLVFAWIIVAIILMIAVFLFALLGKLIGTWLTLALIVACYLVLMLFVFAIMFGVMYYMWRDVCGGDTTTDMAHAISA